MVNYNKYLNKSTNKHIIKDFYILNTFLESGIRLSEIIEHETTDLLLQKQKHITEMLHLLKSKKHKLCAYVPSAFAP